MNDTPNAPAIDLATEVNGFLNPVYRCAMARDDLSPVLTALVGVVAEMTAKIATLEDALAERAEAEAALPMFRASAPVLTGTPDPAPSDAATQSQGAQ